MKNNEKGFIHSVNLPNGKKLKYRAPTPVSDVCMSSFSDGGTWLSVEDYEIEKGRIMKGLAKQEALYKKALRNEEKIKEGKEKERIVCMMMVDKILGVIK